MADHIKQLLATVIQTHGDWKVHLLNNWKTIIGNLHTKVSIEKIERDTLVLGVSDSCWLQELYILSPMLLKKINEKLDRPYIKRIRFKQKVYTKKTKPSIKQEKKRTLKPVTLTSTEQHALTQLQDTELKKVMKAFLIRCYQER